MWRQARPQGCLTHKSKSKPSPAPPLQESIGASIAIAKPRTLYDDWEKSFGSGVRSLGTGSVTLANGSAIVTGTGGTSWSTDLIGKFICLPQGGADYTAYAVMSVLAPDRLVVSRSYS